MTTEHPTLIRADARALPLADESVDLIVTSPPYFALRSYQDGGAHYDGQLGAESSPREFVDALIDCTREMVRVLKPTGSIFVNLGDKYSGADIDGGTSRSTLSGASNGRPRSMRSGTFDTGVRFTGRRRAPGPRKSLMLLPERYRIAAVDELGLIARAVLIWSKPNGLPESVTDRVRRSHEDWVHLTRRPRYFAAVDGIRETYSDRTQDRQRYAGRDVPPRAWAEESGRNDGNGERGILGFGHRGANPLGKLPGSVWEIATQPLKVPPDLGVDHYAAFPMEWPRRLILGWSPPDGTVLDPFGGTGTTALVATMLGRRGISVDLSADYGRLAAWRCSDPKERSRAAGTDPAKVPVVDPGQTDLFGGAA